MIVIGDMLGVAPEDRDDLLRWSDDMLKSLGLPDPDAMAVAATAFVEYTGYINEVIDRPPARRAAPTTWSAPWSTPRSTATASTTTRSSTSRCSS